MNPSRREPSLDSKAEWRKPAAGDHRSPCPALNALANGGHIPRDGNATVDQLTTAIHSQLGLVPSVGSKIASHAMARLGKPGPDGVKVLCLSDLTEHGFIEHDASLTRRDARNGNAAEVLGPLIDQLVALSQDGKTLTLDDLAVAHQLRMAQSQADGHAVSLKGAFLGTLEAALLFEVLSRDGRIAIPDIEEFLRDERIPAHLTPRDIGPIAVLSTTTAVATRGNVPGCDAATRARKAAAEIVEPEVSRCPVPRQG